jgi:hypothetical protein
LEQAAVLELAAGLVLELAAGLVLVVVLVVVLELAAGLVLVVVLVVVLELAVGLELVQGDILVPIVSVFFRKDNARVSYNQIFSRVYRSSGHILDCMG